MADVKAKFLNVGKRLISGALSGFSLVSPSQFKIGTSFGFEPSEDDIAARGTILWTGFQGWIRTKMTGVDTVRHLLIVPEVAGPFMHPAGMGNLVLYGANFDGVATPYLSIVLPFQIEKLQADPGIVDSLAMPQPGTRYVFQIDIKHSINQEAEVTVEVVTPEYASLAFFATEGSVPSPALNPFSQFVVNYDTRSYSPALVTKKSDDTYWGVAFLQNFRDPQFGIFDGGIQGDGHRPSPYGFISGYFYHTPEDSYIGVLGGVPYDHDDSNLQIIGGLPY